MNEDLKIIKKKYGEGMAHFCRDYFSILLEKKGLLPNLLFKKFEPSKILYDDIVKANLEEQFKNLIYSLANVKPKKEEKITKSPKELMSEVGYDLYECRTEEDIQSFKKYYAYGEELCTFRGGRLNSCYVFFAVSHDVDNIRREDFPNPKREDLYGTSVISIQFTRNNSHFLSIKNRYNHRVNNPDATFSNNLNNIVPGLTKSFEDYYGMKQAIKSNNFEISNYVLANDGRYYKYNYELNNIYYCTNNVIIDVNGVHRFEHDKYLVLDYFILDLVNKKIYLYVDYPDSFISAIGEIEKIDIIKTEYGKEIRITNKNNETSIIEIDKENKIIGYINESIDKIGNSFLFYNKSLMKIDLPNAREIGKKFLFYNKMLEEISLPKVEKIGKKFLYGNENLERISLPNAKKILSEFLISNKGLRDIDLPNVIEIGDFFLTCNRNLININLPQVRTIGFRFLYRNNNLERIDLPNVEIISSEFLLNNGKIKEISLPNVRKIGDTFLYYDRNLIEVSLPNVVEVGSSFLNMNEKIKEINLPKVEKIGNYFLSGNNNLRKINLPNVREIGDYFLTDHLFFTGISLPNVIEIGSYFLQNNKSLKNIFLPNVRKIGKCFLFKNINEFVMVAPNLLEVNREQSQNLLLRLVEENKKRMEIEKGEMILKEFEKSLCKKYII